MFTSVHSVCSKTFSLCSRVVEENSVQTAMTGFLGSLTPEEETAMNEMIKRSLVWLKGQVEEGTMCLTDLDWQLATDKNQYLRFLRARGFNVDAAVEMWTNSGVWSLIFSG